MIARIALAAVLLTVAFLFLHWRSVVLTPPSCAYVDPHCQETP